MGDELSQSNYQTVELGDLGRIVTGKTPSTTVLEYFGGDIPFVTPSDMDGRKTISSTDRYLTQDGASTVKSAIIPEGAVMVSCIGSDLGKVAFAGKTSVTNQQINAIIVDRDRFNAEYIYYDLSTRQNELKMQGASGSAVPILNKGNFSKLHMKLPPFDIQAAIAKTLSAFDDKIELNRQMNRTLEAMARAIFKAWFVDFEPVKAKAAGATRFRGMPQDVFDQLPARLTESEMGPVPEGWDVVPLSSLIELIGGGTPKRKEPEYWGGEILWFSVRDAPHQGDVWVVDTEEKITQLGVDNSSAKVMPEGTTIVTARGTVGRLALTVVPMAMNQSCYGVRGQDSVGDFFVYFTLHDAVAALQQRTHGSVFDTITRKTFEGLTRVRPDTNSLKTFEEVVAPFVLRIKSNLFENQLLASIRDTLLPKLISGEIRVPQALEGTDGG